MFSTTLNYELLIYLELLFSPQTPISGSAIEMEIAYVCLEGLNTHIDPYKCIS